jgi:hypothetical protein
LETSQVTRGCAAESSQRECDRQQQSGLTWLILCGESSAPALIATLCDLQIKNVVLLDILIVWRIRQQPCLHALRLILSTSPRNTAGILEV